MTVREDLQRAADEPEMWWRAEEDAVEESSEESAEDGDGAWWRDDGEATDTSGDETTDDQGRAGAGPDDDLWKSGDGDESTDDGPTAGQGHTITDLWIAGLVIAVGWATTDLFAWWSPLVVAVGGTLVVAGVWATRRGVIGDSRAVRLTPPERRYAPTIRGVTLASIAIGLCLRPEFGAVNGVLRAVAMTLGLFDGGRTLYDRLRTPIDWDFEGADTDRV